MKPMGSIPADYRGENGELIIGGERVSKIIEAAGDTPLFVYDLSIIEARIDRLRAAMPAGLLIHYAMKANPFPPLLGVMAARVDGIDVASQGEMRLALDAGAAPSVISFAGPGKRDREIEAALAQGVTLNCESASEVDRALDIGGRIGIAPRLAIRINPDFELRGSGMRMGGRATAFGVDVAEVPDLALHIIAEGAEWRGFHIFSGSQALDPDALVEAQAATLALSARLSTEIGMAPPLVNLGGGFGIPYFPGEVPLDVERIGIALAQAFETHAHLLGDTEFAIELGRWLVGEAGVYLTRIIDRKRSHGETFLVTDGGLHHQLAASGNFGTVVRRNYPVAVANRFGAEAEEAVTVVGCLCTPLDRLGDQVGLPQASPDDVIAVFMAGAYGATASPSAFLGHGPAQEVLLGG
ncbi:pyridoxal-dependent decarboxylase, exosortase A system-associated [Sphingomonas cavernae]|uniref:Pyridoxal-dependent decarboxylase, exosortase A system-associated n=1 Tax=Sphingomonas cavernae TaxID=2320861 RepID=A0A418WN45_9SPHN|nr:pyridoxal-dependent decarboxylase, exosortase A system-associated [Sphingomonas cavernae]RJF91428.1 pyridoxal-dependent decarboxylase, exosortase A system-associated [Sphingomonas cavernae]